MKTLKLDKTQKGYNLVTVGIAILVVLLLSALGLPKFKAYLVQGAVSPVAEEIQRFISLVKVSSQGSGTTPYAGLTQAFFARTVKGSALEVGAVAGQGTGAVDVRHGLGGGDGGTVLLATTGATFSLTFADVSDAACPGLAATLQRMVDGITINATAVKVTDANNTVTTAFIPGTAATRCVDGDNNDFVFTINRS